MNPPSGYQVSGNAAQRYEQYATPYYMAPWVPELLDRAKLRQGERVLDLACGTGVVARHAVARVGASGRVTGLDFNAVMLAVARATPLPPGTAIDWVEGSAVAMDFADAAFDVVLCQQGLQFFPDRFAALREVRRVLVPGGRALFSLWKSTNPYNIAVADAIEQYISAEIAAKYRAARVVPDADALQRMMVESGFHAVEVRPQTLIVQLPQIENFVLGHLSSSPVADALAAMSEARRVAFAGHIKNALRPYAQGDGVAVPDAVNIVLAQT